MPGKLQDNHNETWKTCSFPHHLAMLSMPHSAPHWRQRDGHFHAVDRRNSLPLGCIKLCKSQDYLSTGVGFLFSVTGGPAAILGVWQESLWCHHAGIPRRDHQRGKHQFECWQEKRYGGEGSCHWRTLHLRAGKPSEVCFCRKKTIKQISGMSGSFFLCTMFVKIDINYKLWDLVYQFVTVCISMNFGGFWTTNHVMQFWGSNKR